MKAQTLGIVWDDGKFVPLDEARYLSDAHCLHYGTGVFEGIRSYKRADGSARIFRASDHFDRFFYSVTTLGAELPHTKDELVRACYELLSLNSCPEAYIRPIAFYTDPFHVLTKAVGPVRTVLLAAPYPSDTGAGDIPKLSAEISTFRRSRQNREFYRMKAVGHYNLVFYVANGLKARGAHQAIFLDDNDNVCEAMTDNIFVVSEGKVKTPSPESPMLMGITRDTVINELVNAGVTVSEEDIHLDNLMQADEVFVTSTAGGVRSITEISGQTIGDGQVGRITRQAKALYNSAVLDSLQ